MSERKHLKQIIAHLESQRSVLGDEAVDVALQPLQKKLAELDQAIHDTAPKIISERRVVTVLFCDVSGSTALAEKLDPEEWTNIMNVAFEHFIKPVEQFGGTVTRLMGDAILALFGAPVAHEDDAERAVLAGLEIQNGIRPFRESLRRERGLEFNARVGINTGLVVVGQVGTDGRGEYTAMGDAVNVAARMEQTAQPGTVQIAEATYKLVDHFVECEDLGSIPVKGKGEPTRVYRVLERKTEAGRARGLPGVRTPLVGRDNERLALLHILDQASRGNGQIVCLIGDAGLGKSRLIRELHKVWFQILPANKGLGEDDATGQPHWYETASQSFESLRPYGLFQDFIRLGLGAAQNDPPELVRQKIALFAKSLEEEQQETARQVLETLFGLGDGHKDTPGDQPRLDGEGFKNLLFEIVLNMVRHWAADGSAVIVFDDVHWSDPASVELLIHLFQLAESLPILLVSAFRPERSAPGWQVKVRAESDYAERYTEIDLQPLSNEHGAQLIKRLMSVDKLPDELLDNILYKAGGNPFFVEEVVRTLIDGKIVVPDEDGQGWKVAQDFNTREIVVPDTLHSLLTARIDRLDDNLRRTLQLAALIGRSFHYRVLEAITPRPEGVAGNGGESRRPDLEFTLTELERLELIRQVSELPEAEYVFRHTMVQESAYRSILRGRRRVLHQQVGRAMERLFSERLDDYAKLLAGHFWQAGNQTMTLKYATRAGDAAFRIYANAEAAEHYERAIAAAQHEDVETADLVHIYSQRGRALEKSAQYDEALVNYDAMQRQAIARSDEALKLASLIAVLILRSTPNPAFDLGEGERISEKALNLSRELHDRAGESRILWSMLNLYRFAGYLKMAKGYGESSLEIARADELDEQMAYALNDLSHVYSRLGQYGQAKIYLREAQRLWRKLGDQTMLADNLSTSSYVHVYTGDYDWGDAYSREAYQISKSVNNTWGMSFSRWAVGKLYWDKGQPGRAIELMTEGAELGEAAGFLATQVFTRADLGLAYASLGANDQGLVHGRLALSIAEEKFEQALPYALAILAQIHLLTGNLDEARREVDRLVSSSQPRHVGQPDLVFMAECEVAQASGDSDRALALVEERMMSLRRFGMKAYLPETLLFLGQVLWSRGDAGQALAKLGEASTIAGQMNARWVQWQILKLAAEIETQRGNPDKGKRLGYKAQENIDYIAERTGSDELRLCFMSCAPVQSLLDRGKS